MSARESSSVASSTSARHRRENRLLSLGTLIITHANESVDSRARCNRAYTLRAKAAKRRFAASAKRSKRLPIRHSDGTWLTFAIIQRNKDALSLSVSLISIALINQLTLMSLYDSLMTCRYNSLIVYGFQDSRSVVASSYDAKSKNLMQP